jgi:hypothetical protein
MVSLRYYREPPAVGGECMKVTRGPRGPPFLECPRGGHRVYLRTVPGAARGRRQSAYHRVENPIVIAVADGTQVDFLQLGFRHASGSFQRAPFDLTSNTCRPATNSAPRSLIRRIDHGHRVGLQFVEGDFAPLNSRLVLGSTLLHRYVGENCGFQHVRIVRAHSETNIHRIL